MHTKLHLELALKPDVTSYEQASFRAGGVAFVNAQAWRPEVLHEHQVLPHPKQLGSCVQCGCGERGVVGNHWCCGKTSVA